VFVPAMFMVMDDIGALIWRFAKQLITSGENGAEHASDEASGHKPPSAIIRSPAAE